MAVSITVPETEPNQVIAGDTWTWKKQLSDYLPSDGWVLTYALVKTGVIITITAADDNDDHLIEEAATTTASNDPGIYHWQSYITKSATSERYKYETGTIEVLADFAAQSTGYDNRSFAKKMVDAIEAILPTAKSLKVISISVDGRSYNYADVQSLNETYDFWLAKYRSEERKAGRGKGRAVNVRF